jgi:hypothetical protein
MRKILFGIWFTFWIDCNWNGINPKHSFSKDVWSYIVVDCTCYKVGCLGKVVYIHRVIAIFCIQNQMHWLKKMANFVWRHYTQYDMDSTYGRRPCASHSHLSFLTHTDFAESCFMENKLYLLWLWTEESAKLFHKMTSLKLLPVHLLRRQLTWWWMLRFHFCPRVSVRAPWARSWLPTP